MDIALMDTALMDIALMDIESIIVAGGNASRINGIDKTMLPLGINGEALLQEVVSACPGNVIVVGAKRDLATPVDWVADLVEGGGPAAGIWAGLQRVKSEYVFISAGDQQLTSDIVAKICQEAIGSDGAWAVRSDGVGQPLLACVKTGLIRELLLPTQGVNASPLRLMQSLNMVGVKVDEDQVLDIDTWHDAAKVLKEQAMSEVTPVWLKQVAAILEISESEIPVDALLELTRDVAHNVERKSAPLTTYLIGFAAGKSGVDADKLIEKITAAVGDWKSD